ncbi:hypothetical protein [Nocardia iowensis]|uniref:CheW-like domain-containing protein n=1 Tax=Nocardia iowensis TaxID=204891 RepID=A0ABX8RV35_NOCIO|nr:hypothetical protein [Nocardia iowensis]QXN93146.1 hypothetical protein KV110_08590 [Nocardia iowensis]
MIPALVPGVVPRSQVVLAALPVLADESVVPDPVTDLWLLAAARLDGSGRFRARALLQALDWVPGQRLKLRQAPTILFVHADPVGAGMVTTRGLLALPVATRRWLGVEVGAMVVAVAVPTRGLMVVAAPDRLISLLLEGSGVGDVC